MSLPGCAAIPAPHRERGQIAYETGKRIVEMVWEDLKPSDIITRKALENSIVVNSAIGGSTNATIHINAIARHVGWTGDMGVRAVCPACGGAARVRPDIVWFGEMPYWMDRIEAALASADLFVSIGTSGAVYPAAGFVQTARYHGAETLELNLDPSAGSVFFAESRMGAAGVLVPEWVREVLAPPRNGEVAAQG